MANGSGAPKLPQRHVEAILLATDLTGTSSAATEQAIDLAVRLGARLLVVTVVEPDKPGGTRKGVGQDQRDTRTRKAQGVVHAARAAGADANFLVWEGDAGDGIVAASDAEDVDLVIVGSHGRSAFGRFLLGSVSDYVVRHARCPVLVVRPNEDGPTGG